MSSQNNPEEQNQSWDKAFSALFGRFATDASEVIDAMPPVLALEIVNHLLASIDIFERYIHAEDLDAGLEIYSEYAQLEEALIRRWGTLLKPYRVKQFHLYFEPDRILSLIDILGLDINHNLDRNDVDVDDIEVLMKLSKIGLEISKSELLEKQPPSDEALQLLAKARLTQFQISQRRASRQHKILRSITSLRAS